MKVQYDSMQHRNIGETQFLTNEDTVQSFILLYNEIFNSLDQYYTQQDIIKIQLITSESPGQAPRIVKSKKYETNITVSQSRFHSAIKYLPTSFDLFRWSDSIEWLEKDIRYPNVYVRTEYLGKVTVIIGEYKYIVNCTQDYKSVYVLRKHSKSGIRWYPIAVFHMYLLNLPNDHF